MKQLSHSILLLICLTFLFASFVVAQEYADDDLFIVIVNDKRGYIDRTGKIVIEPQWRGANNFSEGLAIVASEVGYKQGYIDKTGKVLIPLQYEMARDFSEGLAAVGFGEFGLHNSGDHKIGFIDKTGKLVIEPKFRDARSFSEGLAVVSDGGKYGYIDKSGKLVIPLKFDSAFEFSEGLANVRIKNKWGYIDHSGKFIVKPKYKFADKFSEGLAVVKKGGNLITYEENYDESSDSNSSEKWMYIDKTGKIVIKLANNTDSASNFSEGFASVGILKDEILYNGYIDKSGKFVIEPKVGTAEDFSDGMALVIIDGGFGFIDKTGKLFFKCKYPTECAMVNDFRNGLASIQKGGEDVFKNFREAKYGYIDKSGNIIWQPTN